MLKKVLIHGLRKCQRSSCKTRVVLAPLRFGAGIKGKLIEAMQYGTL
jgi:hypothetical protein